jgi:putative nucleotidyltransferase with HDIG domain
MRNKQKLQEKVQGIRTLPTLPQVASRLISIMNSELTSAGDVAKLIGQDPSLAARVLRLANSAFYGMPRSITNVNNAVVILGLKAITTMVVSLSVFDMFPQDKSSTLFDRKAFWKHCLSCAQIGRLLTRKVKVVLGFDQEEAFCAGLLHDIGKIVMEQYLHDDFRTALDLGQRKGFPSYEAEREALGYDHCTVAQWLIERWDLPAELHLPIVFHHAPSESQEQADGVALIHYADWICHAVELQQNLTTSMPHLELQAISRLKIDMQDIEAIKTSIPEEVDKVSAMFLA